MRLYKKNRRFSAKSVVVSVLVFAVVLAAFWYGVDRASQNTEKESMEQMEQAILRAAVNCYAIEGGYPPAVGYLEEHYGVIIDHAKYVVRYDRLGSNIMPDVQVIKRGTGGLADEMEG